MPTFFFEKCQCIIILFISNNLVTTHSVVLWETEQKEPVIVAMLTRHSHCCVSSKYISVFLCIAQNLFNVLPSKLQTTVLSPVLRRSLSCTLVSSLRPLQTVFHDECKFKESLLANNYNAYESLAYRGSYIALSKHGRVKRGNKATTAMTVTHFLPRIWRAQSGNNRNFFAHVDYFPGNTNTALRTYKAPKDKVDWTKQETHLYLIVFIQTLYVYLGSLLCIRGLWKRHSLLLFMIFIIILWCWRRRRGVVCPVSFYGCASPLPRQWTTAHPFGKWKWIRYYLKVPCPEKRTKKETENTCAWSFYGFFVWILFIYLFLILFFLNFFGSSMKNLDISPRLLFSIVSFTVWATLCFFSCFVMRWSEPWVPTRGPFPLTHVRNVLLKSGSETQVIAPSDTNGPGSCRARGFSTLFRFHNKIN